MITCIHCLLWYRSMKTMVSVRFSKEFEQKLAELAIATDRPKSFYVKKLVVENFHQLDKYFREAEALKQEKEQTLQKG